MSQLGLLSRNTTRTHWLFLTFVSAWSFGLAPHTGHAQSSLPKLARGVLTVVPSDITEGDTVTGPISLHELADKAKDWEPNFIPKSDTLRNIAEHMTFRRPAWQFEFAGKPLRLVTVGSGDNRVNVWYLVYRLKNNGNHLRPVTKDGGRSYGVETFDKTLRFFPSFVLRDHEHDVTYLDRIVPGALEKIHAIEIRDPNVPLYDSVRISRVPIEVSTEEVDRSVWGVATWTNVERRADFLSIYVQGLTNGYRWIAEPGKPRKYLFKTLQLNYWRPGDAVHEHEGEFRVGMPVFQEGPELERALSLYQMDERNDYRWLYLP